jgi:erythrocyte band 7 integral membrane protein
MNTTGEQDAIPLTEQSIYSRGGASASTSGNASTKIKQQKGELAVSGVQPSFALELDISTIEHVCRI